MKQIRDNVYYVTHSELGSPMDKSWVKVPGGGRLLIDQADTRFIAEMQAQGYEPAFFISRSPAMGGEYVVISRQWNDLP